MKRGRVTRGEQRELRDLDLAARDRAAWNLPAPKADADGARGTTPLLEPSEADEDELEPAA